MRLTAILILGMATISLGGEYSRSLTSGKLDQEALDAEGYGEKKAFAREEGGLRIKLEPAAPETGWKAPSQLQIGGDFTITARFTIVKMPKPAIEDGVAVGLAIATQSIDQPDVTLLRLVEPQGANVYRAIGQSRSGPSPMMMDMEMAMPMGMVVAQPGGMRPGGRHPKLPRPTFPAQGDSFSFEIRREGNLVRYEVLDAATKQSRYLGQTNLGNSEIRGVKLFACNRSGSEAIEVVLRDLTIRADRLAGLGTTVRLARGDVIYGEPVSLEKGVLGLGKPAQSSSGSSAQPTSSRETSSRTQLANRANVVRAQAMAARAAAAMPAATIVEAAPAPVVVKASSAPVPAVVAATPVGQAAAKPAANTSAFASDPDAAGTKPGGGGAKPGQPIAGFASSQPSASDAAEPIRKVPLDEIESIYFERAAPSFSAQFVGQPNVDVTGPFPSDDKSVPATAKTVPDDVLAPPPGTAFSVAERVAKVEPKKSGIRDLQLRMTGLNAAAIKQVTVSCQTEKGNTSWRLDTTDSRDWPLVLQRSGNATLADLFLEPPPDDCHQKSMNINVMYADNQSMSTTVQIGEHTDAKLTFDARASAAAHAPVTVYLTNDDRLAGQFEGITEASVRIESTWRDHIEVPLERVCGVQFELPDRKELPSSFEKRLTARGTEDLLLARTKDGEVLAVPGILEGTDGDKLRFRYQEASRTLPLRLVEGLILAVRPKSARGSDALPKFSLSDGGSVSGQWIGIENGIWKLETPWGATVNLPAANVTNVRFRGGQVVYLSDLDPSKAQEVSFFGHRYPWRRDVNLDGGPLKMAGTVYERGLAVHSRSELTYDLDGHFAKFQALVGFDDATRGNGRVDCRVFVDDKEVFANPDLRAGEPPVPLEFSVQGARHLRLSVDFGKDQDAGDRVIWANARLLRRPLFEGPSTAPPAAKPGN